MNWITALLCLTLGSCTVTMGSNKQGRSAHRASTTRNAASKTSLVDGQWMARYKAMEAQSNYAIRQDGEIKAENGKFRVPQEVIDHNTDMFIASPPKP